MLRHLALAFSTECQNHANLFSLFGHRWKFIQNPDETFCSASDIHAVGSTKTFSALQPLLL